MNNRTIELTQVIDEVESNPPSLRWIENSELQSRDLAAMLKGVKAIVVAAIAGAGIVLAIAIFSGCASQLPLDQDEYWDSVDGGGEPLGWQSDDSRAELDEELELEK